MQQLISHLQIICDNVYRENAFAVYDHKFQKSFAIYDNVYRENAFACIWSQSVPIVYHIVWPPPRSTPTPPSPPHPPSTTLLPGQTLQLVT